MSEAQPSNDPNARSMGFEPVQGGQETTSAEALLVAAYLVMWALVFDFLGMGWRRQGRLEGRVSELERAIGREKAPRA
jgi:hypothetical protein